MNIDTGCLIKSNKISYGRGSKQQFKKLHKNLMKHNDSEIINYLNLITIFN